jgi:hypothetical protein
MDSDGTLFFTLAEPAAFRRLRADDGSPSEDRK